MSIKRTRKGGQKMGRSSRAKEVKAAVEEPKKEDAAIPANLELLPV